MPPTSHGSASLHTYWYSKLPHFSPIFLEHGSGTVPLSVNLLPGMMPPPVPPRSIEELRRWHGPDPQVAQNFRDRITEVDNEIARLRRTMLVCFGGAVLAFLLMVKIIPSPTMLPLLLLITSLAACGAGVVYLRRLQAREKGWGTNRKDMLAKAAQADEDCKKAAAGPPPPEVPHHYSYLNPVHGVDWTPSFQPGMGLIIGSARSGKDAGVIGPILLTYYGSVFCVDPKGESTWLFRNRRAAIGQDTYVLDPFGEVTRGYAQRAGVEPEPTTKYNPLADLDPTAITFADDAAALGEAIFDLDPGSKFFSNASRSLFVGCCAAVVQANPGRGTLREVRRMLILNAEQFKEQCQSIVEMYPGTLAESRLRPFTVVNRTNDGVRDTAREETAFLDSEELLRSMEPSPNDPVYSPKVLTATKRTTVFAVLPPTHHDTHKRWLRLVMMQHLRHLYRSRHSESNPVMFMLNEAGTVIGNMQLVEQAYGIGAGMGMTVISTYQDIGQMQRDYPKSWETFITNSRFISLVRAGDNATAEYFSRWLGNTTVEYQTESRSENTGTSSGSSLGSSAGGGNSSTNTGRSSGESSSTSTVVTGRPLRTPDEIRNLWSQHKVLTMFPGERTFETYRLDYYKVPEFKGLYRVDPKYRG